MDPVFFIKSTKIGVFYQYGYTDITTFRDPWSESQKVCQHNNTKYISTELLSITTEHHLYKKIVKIFTPTEKHNI